VPGVIKTLELLLDTTELLLGTLELLLDVIELLLNVTELLLGTLELLDKPGAVMVMLSIAAGGCILGSEVVCQEFTQVKTNLLVVFLKVAAGKVIVTSVQFGVFA